jgi:hypothetical protein
MSVETFRGSELKLDRAEHHVIELHNLMKRFVQLQTYKVVADMDLDPGYISWVARGEEVMAHDNFAPIIGDAIHNMRDALDLAVSALMRQAGQSDEHVYFPTAKSRNDLQETIAKRAKKQPFPGDLVRVLETIVQPYIGGNGYLLRTLHALAIMDKHRLIVPTIFGTSIVYTASGGSHIPILISKPVPVKDGAVLTKNAVADLPNIKVGQEALAALTVVFDETCGQVRNREVVQAVRELLYATKDALEAMRDCLRP